MELGDHAHHHENVTPIASSSNEPQSHVFRDFPSQIIWDLSAAGPIPVVTMVENPYK
jgi:hypothetical protein